MTGAASLALSESFLVVMGANIIIKENVRIVSLKWIGYSQCPRMSF
jgi:hypothetical protein